MVFEPTLTSKVIPEALTSGSPGAITWTLTIRGKLSLKNAFSGVDNASIKIHVSNKHKSRCCLEVEHVSWDTGDVHGLEIFRGGDLRNVLRVIVY